MSGRTRQIDPYMGIEHLMHSRKIEQTVLNPFKLLTPRYRAVLPLLNSIDPIGLGGCA